MSRAARTRTGKHSLSGRTGVRSAVALATGTGAGASVVLAILVLATVFVAVVTPRASVAFRTRALQQVFAATPLLGRSVIASSDFISISNALGAQPGTAGGVSSDQLAGIGGEVGQNLTARHVPLQPPGHRWWGLASGYSSVPDASRHAYFGSTPPKVEVLYRPQLGRYARLLSGHLPDLVSTSGPVPVFEVAVTRATAARFRLRPGSALTITGAVLRVSGIVAPAARAGTFWQADPDAAGATFNASIRGSYWLGAVFIGAAEFGELQGALDSSQMTLQWQYPLRLGRIGAGQAAALSNSLGTALTDGGLLTRNVQVITSVSLSCGLTGALLSFIAAQARIGTLLALLEVSLVILGAVVLLLGCRLLAERRTAEFALMRARGAGGGQLTALALRAGVIAVLPAAVAGALAAVLLTPGASEPAAAWLGTLTALAALTAVPVLAVRRAAAGAGTGRADSPAVPLSRVRRLVIDAMLVLAAAGGLLVLRQEGTPAPGRTDWFTSAAPVLVAVPVAVLMVRLYPAAVGWLVRLTGRRRGVTTFVGLARAARSSATAVLPAFALVLVLGLIAFGATLRAAVVRGDTAASWRATGADVVVDASLSSDPLDQAVRRAFGRIRGVRQLAVVGTLPGSASDGTPVSVVLVDPADYAALIAATPQPRFPAADLRAGAGAAPGRLGVLMSPGALAVIHRAGKVQIGYRDVAVRYSGPIRSVPGSGTTAPLVVAPLRAMAAIVGTSEARPDRLLLVGPRIDGAQVRALARRMLPAATVTLRSRRDAEPVAAPLSARTYVAFAD
ncbi:MAG: hypothetical protein ACR2FU_07270, partial [Streptosporangiaceae bacterium]